MSARVLTATFLSICVLPLTAGCGQQETDAKAPGQEDKLTSVAPEYRDGAKLFVERCSGCHTMGLVGAEGGAFGPKDTERVDGPNFNVRKESYENVIYALRNGGFSAKQMPKNLATGEEAEAIARFLERYAGYASKDDRKPDGNSRAE